MPLDEGLGLLAEAAASVDDDPEELVDGVLAALIGDNERPDDIAVLAIRFATSVIDDLRLVLPSSQEGLVEMRDGLRSWLSRANVADDEAAEAVLAVWEACANAVEHAQVPSESSFQLEARLDDAGRMRVEVRDTRAVEGGGRLGGPRARTRVDAIAHGHRAGEPRGRRDRGRARAPRPGSDGCLVRL